MEFPLQMASFRKGAAGTGSSWDMREELVPRRLTMVMWDNAFLLRHIPGGSFEDYEKVLEETIERGYNTVRLDPMPQWVDLSRPETVLEWSDPKIPYMPWNWNSAVKGPVGLWLIEFMEKVLAKGMNYTLSAWWFNNTGIFTGGPALLGELTDHRAGAELWIRMLREWKRRFGFEGLMYVDLANEVPYFFPGFLDRMKKETGYGWENGVFNEAQIGFIAKELNEAIHLLMEAFPELRFTSSIHGDVRWLDVPVEFDCLDVHFYADADPRWMWRTQFHLRMPELFTTTHWHKDFSDRAMKTARAISPMLRARQREKVSQFAGWANRRGMPLTTTESWASWYMFDSPDLDWSWLLEWSEWSVDDALEFGMWGWTPHNYCQPQFANWQEVRWHQRLTQKFLRG